MGARQKLLQEVLNTEWLTRTGSELWLDDLVAVKRLTPLPLELACVVHGFMHNSVNPEVQREFGRTVHRMGATRSF